MSSGKDYTTSVSPPINTSGTGGDTYINCNFGSTGTGGLLQPSPATDTQPTSVENDGNSNTPFIGPLLNSKNPTYIAAGALICAFAALFALFKHVGEQSMACSFALALTCSLLGSAAIYLEIWVILNPIKHWLRKFKS